MLYEECKNAAKKKKLVHISIALVASFLSMANWVWVYIPQSIVNA